tara:strand:- start:243 stop:761 length:519 start_codon:yes stop_codon:yes gene_type:complete
MAIIGDIMTNEHIAGAMGVSLKQMNDYINRNGRMRPSSQVIKNWHEYDNAIWKCILTCAKILVEAGKMKVPGYVEKDIDFLLTHIEKCADYTDNVLYPHPHETARLPDAVTHANLAKHRKSIKSRTFRTMMNVREGLNEALEIWLPNVDTAKGTLNLPTFDDHFEVEGQKSQ